VSETAISIRSPRGVTAIVTRPPGRVNFIAFDNRFQITHSGRAPPRRAELRTPVTRAARHAQAAWLDRAHASSPTIGVQPVYTTGFKPIMTDLHRETSSTRGERRMRPMVVGLGASAGGIKALKEFFRNAAPDSGIAYVVILHLSPDFESKLAEVLQATARVPVTQVTEAVDIEPNHVYVVPQSRILDIQGMRLDVTEMTRLEQRRSPVDLFFRALADAHGSRSVCVVLSGTGPNGSAGLKRVKEYGGLAIAQDPNEAEYPDMPLNAIATGLVDLVLPVAHIPARIARFEQHLRLDADDVAPSATSLESPEALRKILALVRVRTGHDFSNYKDATLQRRIQRRMNVHSLTTFASYAQFIREEPNEALLLMRELLISVTSFFRDPDAFQVLEQRIIPRLFINKQPHDQVRVWVAGCATGEEAYSIAMLLVEHWERLPARPALQVFATDLDEHAIAIARDGLYSDADVADLSEERLQRFFFREAAGYRVRRELRELLLFAHHNVIRDPPFSHLDLISCRNLLIYLTRFVQERLVETFHFALRPGAYLFLGTSETPEGTTDLFFRAEPAIHLYESRSVTSRLTLPQAGDTSILPPQMQAKTAEPRTLERIAPADLHLRLLEQYGAPSLLISEDYSVVHVSERATRYLQVIAGEPSRELLKLIRPELRAGLRSALHQAAKRRITIDVPGLRVGGDHGDQFVNLTVRPVLREGEPPRGFFLVLFEPADGAGDGGRAAGVRAAAAAPTTPEVEHEFAAVKAELRATIEQYEIQAEDAKAGNEELQALNEELRSAAEELETSKEELQSLNEELTTVNQELKIKIEELSLTNNDFQNLMSATDIGSIFLDRALCVKLSTPKARQVFNLLDSDIGRPLTDITSTLRDTSIHADMKNVLDRLQNIEREVQTEDERWHLMRVLPYRTTDNRIDGVVVTFQDITARRQAEQHVRQSEERLRALIESATDYAIFSMTDRGAIDSWSPGAERMFGYAAHEAIGQHFSMLFVPEDRDAGVPDRELIQARTHRRAADERYHIRKNGSRFYCSGVTTRLGDGDIGFAKIARDLTESAQAKADLERARAELERRVELRTAELALEVHGHAAANTKVMELLRRVVSTEEDERRRISHELHDDIGQQLTGLRLALERVQATSPGCDLSPALDLTSSISRAIDFIAWQLRPAVLDELGLAAALPRFVSTWSAHVGVHADCRVERYAAGMLTPEAELTCYRILQEALHNVAKHARAQRVDVVLTVTDGQVVLIVEDDGVGFDPSKTAKSSGGLGLAGMRERAALVQAKLQVESGPGKGTSVFLRCPTASPQAALEGGPT
jgi:two-component system CheB/CheR fusion protein